MTNVPADTKPIKSDSPLIHQGTAPPAAKNDFISFAEVLENESHINKISIENSIIIK
jgi:hypothetical protein